MHSPLRRPRAAQLAIGASALAALALLTVPVATAGPANVTAADKAGGRAAEAAAQQAGAGLSAATRQRLAVVADNVNSLVGKMTITEKFGQLEMAGPSGPN